MRVRVGIRKMPPSYARPAGIAGYAHEAAHGDEDGLPTWVEIDGVRVPTVMSVEHKVEANGLPTVTIVARCESYELVADDAVELTLSPETERLLSESRGEQEARSKTGS